MTGGIRVVLVGHVGFAEDDTPFGSAVNLGGSGYAAARGATAAPDPATGLVARVGTDFDLAALRRLGLDLAGVRVVEGRSAWLHITQLPGDRRSIEASHGAAAVVEVDSFPAAYAGARFVHLATMPLRQQCEWLDAVRRRSPGSTVSVDMFEPSAAEDPATARRLCRDADLVFLNAEEHRILFSRMPPPDVPMVLKAGPAGATYADGDVREHAPAPPAQAIDTTGAGELLAGAFLALLAGGVPRPAALGYAVEVASAKVAEFGVDGPLVSAALERVRSRAIRSRAAESG